MKKKDYIILMADIVGSSNNDQKKLMGDFKNLTREINSDYKQDLLSPMTITLGDEFQGVVKNVSAAIGLIFSIEEKIIQRNTGFKLRYVLFEGAIDTPINKEIAYGMLGDGLTKAREALEEIKGTNYRYYLNINNKKTGEALRNSMFIYQSMIDDWNTGKDYDLITKFIELKDYKEVARELGKSRSQIWKREKSLKIEEYFSIKSVISYLAETV